MTHAFDQESVYGIPKVKKQTMLLAELNALTSLHMSNCREYEMLLRARHRTSGPVSKVEDIPFIPVRLFKSHLLKSIDDDKIVKVLSSSGTTGQQVSRIVLDGDTAAAQSKTLVRIMQSHLGKARLPMIVVDHDGVIKDRNAFSARGAGIRGMANFGREHFYALQGDNMSLDVDGLEAYVARHSGARFLLFGFTFMVWEYLVSPLLACGRPLNINGVLVHSGGWKKLADRAVSNDEFKAGVARATGIIDVHNFYGMVEQVGSVFVECTHGHLHAPAHADVLIRSPFDWSVLGIGQRGLIQVLSILPRSYPGHSLLTEDEGELLGEDDCGCGALGKYFKVYGRLPAAEARGCSDTHVPSSS